MRFPDKLTVLARDRDTRLPAKGVAILLVLFAARKNDYSVGPLITNENGQVEFTRAECESAIKQAQEAFVMDYHGDLESCRPLIEVRLHLPEYIEKMLQNYKTFPEFWGQGFPKSLFTDLRMVRNADFESAIITATEEQILTNPQLVLPLVKKAVRAKVNDHEISDKLTVLARDRDTRLPAKGVAILLVLFAARKNDYYVGPFITDEKGQVEFVRADCEFSIKRAQEMFIMDYQDDLESCRPVIEVSLHPPERIEGMRQQYESAPDFWGRGFHDPKRLFPELQKVKNGGWPRLSILNF
jgi:hypothetical protein